MRTITHLPLIFALALPVVVAAQSVPSPGLKTQEFSSSGISFETLSDTKGTQLNSYLEPLACDLQQTVKNSQLANTAEAGRPQPVNLVLTIDSRGKLVALRLESADTPTSKAVWRAAKEFKYAPLPDGLHDASLRLSLHYAAL